MGRWTNRNGSRTTRHNEETASNRVNYYAESTDGRRAKAEMVVALPPPPLHPHSPHTAVICTSTLAHYASNTNLQLHKAPTTPHINDTPRTESIFCYPEYNSRQCTDTHTYCPMERLSNQPELCTGMKLALVGGKEKSGPKTMARRHFNDSGFCTGIITTLTSSCSKPLLTKEVLDHPSEPIVVVAAEKGEYKSEGLSVASEILREDDSPSNSESYSQNCSDIEEVLLHGYQLSQEQGKPLQYHFENLVTNCKTPIEGWASDTHRRLKENLIHIATGSLETPDELVMCVDNRVPPVPQFPDEKLVIANRCSLQVSCITNMAAPKPLSLPPFFHNPSPLQPPPSPPPPSHNSLHFSTQRHSDFKPFVCNMS